MRIDSELVLALYTLKLCRPRIESLSQNRFLKLAIAKIGRTMHLGVGLVELSWAFTVWYRVVRVPPLIVFSKRLV